MVELNTPLRGYAGMSERPSSNFTDPRPIFPKAGNSHGTEKRDLKKTSGPPFNSLATPLLLSRKEPTSGSAPMKIYVALTVTLQSNHLHDQKESVWGTRKTSGQAMSVFGEDTLFPLSERIQKEGTVWSSKRVQIKTCKMLYPNPCKEINRPLLFLAGILACYPSPTRV